MFDGLNENLKQHITSASSPDFSDIHEWKKKSVEKLQEVDEDLDEFTGKNNEVDVEAILHHIEAEMSKATTSKGKARFSNFKGASDSSDLAKLMAYNDNKKDEAFSKARDLKESILQDADATSITIGNHAYTDLKNGKINEEQYDEIMSTLEKAQGNPSEAELNEEVSETFLEYLWDNKVDFAKDTAIDGVLDYAAAHGTLKLGGMINTFRGVQGNGFVMVNPKSAQYAKPFLNPKTHKWAVNAGKWGGRVATPVGFGIGWYDDVQNNGKTHGQAIAHNGATTGVGIAATAGTLALVSNPGGWAILGAAAVGTGAAMGADYLYKNNKTVQKSVDWVGDRLSDIGQGIKSFFSNPGPSVSEHHSPGFNAP